MGPAAGVLCSSADGLMTAILLRVVCAWCGAVLSAGTPGALISHGICDSCSARKETEAAA